MRSSIALTFLAVAGFAAAQEQYNIDPESVSIMDRNTWCLHQTSACPFICTQLEGIETMTTLSNECDPETLVYSCICDNGVTPNITQYSQTIPYYICTEWGTQCVKDCGRDSACADSCRADHPCGAQDPPKGNASISAKQSQASKTATQTAATSIPVDGWGGSPATDTPNKPGAAPAMLNLGQGYGLAVLVGGIVGGFALIL